MDESKRTSAYGEDKPRRGPTFKVLALLLSLTAIFLVSLSLAYLSKYSDPVRNNFVAAPKYTLHYNENVGTLEIVGNMPGTAENYSGSFDISSRIPTREGYKFLGWADTAEPVEPATELAPVYAFEGKDVSGNATLQSSVSVTAEDNYSKTIYAVWQKAKYTLIFNANGGDGAPTEQEAEATGDSYTFTIPDVIPTHSNSNKVFLGWATSESATAPAYAFEGKDHNGNVTLQPTVEVTAAMTNRSLTLYAVWATRYTLHFDPNSALGGYGNVPDTQTALVVADSHTFVIPAKTVANTPSRDGVNGGAYEFGWWSPDPDPDNYDGTNTYPYGSGYRVTKDDPEQTLYAFYIPLTPAQLLLYRNNDANDNTVLKSYAGTGTETLAQAKIELSNPSRSNYKFLGWAETPDATVKQYDKGDYVTINRLKENDKILYAVWQPLHSFSVNFVYNAPTFNKYGENEVFRLVNGQWKTSWLFGNTTVWAADGSRYRSDWRFISGWNGKSSTLGDWRWIDENSYTWNKAFWQQNGVYAERLNVKIADYEFLGWSTDPNATEAMYTVGSDNCIEQSITVNCPGGENCVAGADHQLVLFAVWKTTPKHYYRLIFSANNWNDETMVNKVTGQRSPHPQLDYNNNGGTNEIVSMLRPAGANENYYNTSNSYTTDIHDSGSLLLSGNAEHKDSYTWTAEELNESGPLASKNATSTARYVLAGWTFKKNDTKIDVPVDENGNLLGDICIVHSSTYNTPTAVLDDTTKKLTVYVPEHDDTESGEGCGHNLILYPVWRTEPLHQFKVYFTAGSSNATMYRYDTDSKNWVSGQSNFYVWPEYNIYGHQPSVVYYNANVPYLFSSPVMTSDQGPPEEWTEDFWKAQGAYVTRPDDATLHYEFAGWSYKPRIDERGRAVYDQVNIEVDANGFLLDAPNFDDLVDDCHSKPSGAVHTLVLYPVWRITPLNTYSLVFVGNGGDVFYRENGEQRQTWNTTSFNWPSNVVKVLPDGTTASGGGDWRRSKAWTTEPLPVAESRSKTWSAEFVEEHAVTAQRYDTDTMRYKLLGWAYTANAAQPDIPVDENGFFSQAITTTDPWNHTEEGHHFITVLYAVWEEEEIHSYQVRFNRNCSGIYFWNNIKYYDDGYGYWTEAHEGRPLPYTSEKLTRNQRSYTWDTDFWDVHGLYAFRESEEFYDFAFLGWAKDPNATTPDYPVEWRTENGQQHGYIAQDITFEEPHDPCAGGVHIIDLYAVYGRVPKTRTFTLSFNPNRGSGTFEPMTQTETYNGTAWAESSEPFTIPTEVPTYGSRLFVGWAESNTVATGVYGYMDTTDAKTEDATRHLQGSISYPYGTDGKKTLYAVWWNSYRLNYDVNAGGDVVSGIPPSEYSYWSVNSHTYNVSNIVPQREGYTFLGWATSANGAVEYAPGSKITLQANNDGLAERTLYAVWEPLSNTTGQSSNAPLMQSAAPLWDDYAPAPENDPDLTDSDAEE